MKQLIVMAIAAMAIPVLAQDAPERPARQRGAQMPAIPQEMLTKYDKDGDGKLSQEERAAMRADMQKEMKTRREEAFKAMDKDGDGKVSLEEFLAAPPPAGGRPGAAGMQPRGQRPQGAPEAKEGEGVKPLPRGERPQGAPEAKDGEEVKPAPRGNRGGERPQGDMAEIAKERRTRQFKTMDKGEKGYITLEDFTATPAFGEGVGPARPGAAGGQGQGNRPAGRGARGARPAAE